MFGVVNTMLHTACNIFFKVRYQPPIDSGCVKLKPYTLYTLSNSYDRDIGCPNFKSILIALLPVI